MWGRPLWSTSFFVVPTFTVGRFFWPGRAMLALLQMVDLRCGADLYGRPFYLARASDARPTTFGRRTLWGRPLWSAILFGQGERCSHYYKWSTYSVGQTFMVGHFIWPGRAMLALLQMADLLCGANLYGRPFYLARASDARPITFGRLTLWGRPLRSAILFGQGERCSPYYIWSTYSVGPTFTVGHFIWPGRAMLALLQIVDRVLTAFSAPAIPLECRLDLPQTRSTSFRSVPFSAPLGF